MYYGRFEYSQRTIILLQPISLSHKFKITEILTLLSHNKDHFKSAPKILSKVVYQCIFNIFESRMLTHYPNFFVISYSLFLNYYHEDHIFFFGGGGGGEIFDSGIFLGGKILQISFWWLDLSWDFWGVFKAI